MRTEAFDPFAGIAGTPVRREPSIHNGEPGDVASLATALARAFLDDPFASYCLPRASTRLRKLEVGFAYQLRRIWLRHGTTYTTRERDGVAVWLPPGAGRPSALEQLRMLPAAIVNARMETLRSYRGFAALEKVHPREPHYYLPLVGVVPDRRARGIGHALLQPVLERCDREGMPAYLEATNERAIALYERNGFEVLRELRLPKDGPCVWPMWRRGAAEALAGDRR